MVVGKVVFLSVALLAGASYADDSSNNRIIGGESAKIEDFPYQVSLQAMKSHFCGGSIISDRHILTAAHCITNMVKPPYSLIRVITGSTFTNKGGEAHRIAKVDVHPNWTHSEEDSLQNDLAVITLKDKIEFNEHQQKVKLPTKYPEDGEEADFTGWGLIRQTPNYSPVELQKIKTTIVTYEKCQKKMIINADETKLYENQVCAFRARRIGACSGDSGGPLVVDGEIVGVASWIESERCAIGSPDVYTNVYSFIDFIESVMNKT